MKDDLLLTIDGHSMAFRAFYALPIEMVSKDGVCTNAVYGFASMLSNIIGQFNPTHLVVAFDTSAPTFRSEIEPAYKAQRGETPEEFIPQTDLIINLLSAMNIPVSKQDGVEADDIIATFATRAKELGMPSMHVTGDRDYFQLVEDPFVNVMYVRRGVSDTVVYDEAGIIERTGITPKQYVDYAAMRGDPSDNLPGIMGVGEKTASKLLIAHYDLEGIYKNLDTLTPKMREKFEEAQGRVFMNRELMTLVRDVKELPSIDELKRTPGDSDAIAEICEELQFRTLGKKILTAAQVNTTVDGGVTRSAASQPALSDDRPSTSKAKSAGVSKTEKGKKTSVSSIAIEDAKIEKLSPSKFGDLVKAAKVPLGIHLDLKTPSAHVDGSITFPLEILASDGKQVSRVALKDVAELKKVLQSMLNNAENLVGYDIKMWGSYFALCELPQIACNDLYVMAAIDDAARGKKTLEQACANYLGIAPAEDSGQLDFGGSDPSSESNVDSIQIAKVLYLSEMYEEINSRLEEKELQKLYVSIERPLTPVIADIETHGVFVDQKRLKVISKGIHERCETYKQEIKDHAGEELNVNSTQQLRKILFDKLGLTPIKKTKTGPSTDAATLNALRDEHPIVEAILRYREVEKLRSTYIDALGPLISSDGRIHATFNQAITSTGRISSEAPNLQNIPIRTEEGKNLRTMFVAPKGSVLCAIDYSQIELRILAHLSKEKALVDAFKRGDDVHATTAAEVFEVDLEDVTSEQRSFAKVVNFGIAYGMESYGLATRMGIDPGHAKEILDSYWSTFTSMKKYLDQVVVEATKVGYTETLFGRRRYFPELLSANARVRIAGARAATNAPVQGTAADVFKMAMVNVAKVIKEQDLPAHMVLTVHDELVFEIPKENADEVSKLIASTMENVVDLDVPLLVEVGIGSNWAEAK